MRFLTFILLLPAACIFSQTPAYLHYDVSDGLPSALVYCVEQDSRGLLWFGTDKGLARFDGTRFRVYNMRDGLPDPEVFNIYEDSRQRLWFSCFRKKPFYWEKGRFITERQDTLLSKLKMEGGTYTFFDDRKGSVWMTDRLFAFGKLSCDSISYFRAQYPIITIHSIGKEVFAFGSWGIYKMGENRTVQIAYNIPEPFFKMPYKIYFEGQNFIKKGLMPPTKGHSLPKNVSVAISGRRVLYIYPEGILLLEYNGAGFKEIDRLMGIGAVHVTVDMKGRFWVISQTNGAICFNHLKSKLKASKIYLSGKKISNVYQDREGTIWFPTLNEGVYALTENSALSYSQSAIDVFKSNNLTSLAKLDNGTLLVGDDSGNLYLYFNGQWILKQLGSIDGYNLVRQILRLPGNHWLTVTDEAIHSSTLGRIDNRSDGAYKAAFYCKEKTWLGTSSFLIFWEEDYSNSKISLVNRITSIGSDGTGNIWAGGLNGLFSERDSFKVKWGERFPELASRIVAIQKADKEAIWVVTPDYGLLRVKVTEGAVIDVEVINDRLKSPIDNIQSMFVEPEGKVWLSTNKGVYALDKKYTVTHFSEKDGLANDDVNAVLVHNDTLWAATVSGLSCLNLRQDEEKGDFPTYVTGFRFYLDQKKFEVDLLDTLQEQRKVVLPPGISLLELDLTGIHYRSRGNLHYEFITTESLLPFPYLTWSNVGNWLFGGFRSQSDTALVENGSMNFGLNIRPGQYLFRVTALLPSGVRSLQPDERSFVVLPFWTETIWFSLILIGVAIFIIWRLVKARVAFRQLKSAASELQLQAIKAQINPHFIGNSINAIQQFFYPPDPVKASQYISIFSDLLRRTMFFSEKNFISFYEELGYMRDYLEMIRLRFGERFSFEITGAEKLTPETPFPAMLLQPLLENATIHGLAPNENSRLAINFYFNDRRLFCVVTDNGVGIHASRAKKKINGAIRPSKGLILLEKKVLMLNKLHPLDLQLEIRDLAEKNSGAHGTQAVVSFLPDKVVFTNFKSFSTQLMRDS